MSARPRDQRLAAPPPLEVEEPPPRPTWWALIGLDLVLGGLLGMASGLLLQRLARSVARGRVTPFDERALARIVRWRTPARTRLMVFITRFGDYPRQVAVMVVTLALMHRRGRGPLQMTVVAGIALGSLGLATLFKRVFRRARPGVEYRLVRLHYYSFPSGHALTALSVYGIVAYLVSQAAGRPLGTWQVWGAAGGLVLAVGVSRVYLGAHYPTDVAAGYLVGLPWLAAGAVTIRLLRQLRRLHEQGQLPPSLLGWRPWALPPPATVGPAISAAAPAPAPRPLARPWRRGRRCARPGARPAGWPGAPPRRKG